MKKFYYEKTILEHHLDTLGHVNNSKYLEIFEEARWDLSTKAGFGLKTFQKIKKGPIVLSLTLDFKKEIMNRQKILIVTQVKEISKNYKFITLDQKIYDYTDWYIAKSQNLEASFYTELEVKTACFDLESRKLIPPTKQWLKALELIDSETTNFNHVESF